MPRGPWSARRIVAASCVAALLAGCGASGSGSSGDSAADSPLNALFGGNVSSAESRAQQLKQEEKVAECMKAAGWDYTPVDYTAQFGNDVGAADADLSPAEYAKKYAYGIMHNYELYELPNLLNQNGDATSDTVPDKGFQDPNSDYVNSLTSDEQTQYYSDLYGDQSQAEPVDAGTDDTVVYTPPPLEEQGCQGKAQQEVYGDSPMNDPDIQSRMNDLYTDLNNDPKVKAAQRDWKTCMTKQNTDWDFPSPGDVYQYFEKRKAELSGQDLIEADFDPQTGQPLDDSIDTTNSYSSSYDENGHGYVITGQPKPLSETQIDQLRKEEFTIYAADQKCQKNTKLTKVQHDAEQKLVDALLKEFPQLKDVAKKGGAKG